MSIAFGKRASIAWTFVLLAAATPARAQVQLPLPPSNAPAPTTPELVDPLPVYHPPVYQPPVYQPQAEAVPTPTPAATTVPLYAPSMASRAPVVPSVPNAPTPAPIPETIPYSPPSLPGYASGSGGPAYAQPAPSMYGGGMPTATYDRQNFPPYGSTGAPPKYKKWMPTYSVPLCGHGCGHHGAMQNEYAAGCDPACISDGCGADARWCDNIALITEMNAFKGGLDLDGLNGNFGVRAGVLAGIPIVRSWGLGAELGGTAGVYDWKGSQFTGGGTRYQSFMTAGIFQRFCSTGLGYAVVYDWLIDDYYNDFFFGQWRAAVSWQFNPCNEIGVWVALPDRRDSAFVGTPAVNNYFSSVMQGNVYWRHVWSCAASTTIFAGLAEQPSNIPFGASSQVAINNYVALTGGFEYILPSSGGNDGRQEEIWALSAGLVFYPGSAMRVAQSQFRPFLPMADNGNFAIRRH